MITRLLLSGLLFLALCTKVAAQTNPLNIDIVRDKWGVPHIYGKTDADAAYGLAWATSEDDFKTIQEILLATRGRLGEVNGKDGAILDFLAFICGTDKAVDTAYDTAFSAEYKKVLTAYVDGLNSYAAAFPNEVLRNGVFPVTCKDVIKGYVFTNMLLTSVYLDVQKIFTGLMKNYEGALPSGSNGFAFNSSRTKDGKTYLGVNSHQPLEGMFSWYEAHVNSEEGMNMLGATFAGGVSIFLGTNEHLGWACTLNHPDMDDVYKLQMNPKNHLQYWFDDHWETLEVRKKTVKVKVGPIRLPITKTFYWSKYGTTLKNKNGYYSIRFPANMEIRTAEQVYHMDKARNFTEWHAAMSKNEIPGVNVVYADRNDTIYFVSAADLPYRNPKYNWLKVLPGNTSATLWAPHWYPFDSLPHLLNPKSGYLLNTNNSCFECTATGCNPLFAKYDVTMGYGTERNNRSIMAHYLISKYDKLSYDDFKTVKYNRTWNDSMGEYALSNMMVMMNLDVKKYPDLKDAMDVVHSWNHQTDVNNEEAPLLAFAMYNLIDIINARASTYESNSFTEQEYVKAMRSAKKHMLKYFGSLRVPLGDVQKHVRGNIELPIGGAPEVLAATITQPYKKGMRRTFVGDSYIELVRYSKDSVQIETINAYGASAKPGSPHYTDQMQMFVDQKLKPMTLDKASIYRDAEKIYHPVKTKEEPLRVMKN